MSRPRYARYAGLIGVLIVALVVVNTLLVRSDGAAGIAPGKMLAPFAVPLALGNLRGDANVATHAHEGSAGNVPACSVRGTQVLNLCQLYEHGPVVLALFVNSGGCTRILSEMQSLLKGFPGVRFAAVAIEGQRSQLRRLVRARGLSLPVGIDEDGAVATIYKVFSCPQVNFAYPGGVVQSKALLRTPSLAELRARVGRLVAASRARGWQGAKA
jgi:hypothetical protein